MIAFDSLPTDDDGTTEALKKFGEQMKAAQATCQHAGWDFAKHGRCCWGCGAFMVDFGD